MFMTVDLTIIITIDIIIVKIPGMTIIITIEMMTCMARRMMTDTLPDITITIQWWIQDFPKGGMPTPKVGVPTYYFTHFFCRKLHEIETIWTPVARPWHPANAILT